MRYKPIKRDANDSNLPPRRHGLQHITSITGCLASAGRRTCIDDEFAWHARQMIGIRLFIVVVHKPRLDSVGTVGQSLGRPSESVLWPYNHR